MKRYLVGGAVRDRLLGLPVGERDWVVVGATPEALQAQGYKPVGRDFPVFIHPRSGEEYALARTERKSGRGYHGFVFHAASDVTLEQDLVRRDLTINAIAEDEHGTRIDPFHGQADIQARVLRHVSPAFAEDPLRVLRVARFAARFAAQGFNIADETFALMQQLVQAGELQHLTPERVLQETHKALCTDSPHVYFQVLRDCGALAVLFPEIDRLFGVPQPPKHHPEVDSGVHTLLALEQAARLSEDAAVRFAVLVHDLGKGITPADLLPKHHGHEDRGVPLVTALCERLRAPRTWRELAVLVCRYHLHSHRAAELNPGTILKVLMAADAFRRPERFAQFLLACEADARGRTGLEERDYPQAALLARALEAARGVAAAALAGNAAGPVIARRLQNARVAAIAAVIHKGG